LYLSLNSIFKLILLPCAYFLAIICFWGDIGSYIFLLGVLLLFVNTIIFTFPIINYLSLLSFSFLALYAMNVSWEYILYETIFWGVQGIWICVIITTSIYTKRFYPLNPSKKQKKLTTWIKYHNNIIVEFDCYFHTIIDVSRGAQSFYGWKKRELINKSVLLIHNQDFLQFSPKNFIEILKDNNIWTGFMEVCTKDGDIYEERAEYTPFFDSKGSLERIKKRVIEAFYKENNSIQKLYENIFDTHPSPMMLINHKGLIERTNKSLMKILSNKPICNKQIFYKIFSNLSQKKIFKVFQNTLLGYEDKILAFMDNMPEEVELIFIPCYDKRNKKVNKIFLVIKQLPIILPKETTKVNRVKQIVVGSLLKTTLTELYYHYSKPSIKLMSGILPTINIIEDQWKKLFYNFLLLSLNQDINEIKKITITCVTVIEKYFFKIDYEGIKYTEFTQKMSFESNTSFFQKEFVIIKEILKDLNANPEIIQGKQGQTIISFLYQEKYFFIKSIANNLKK